MKKKSLFISLLAISTIFTIIGCNNKSHEHTYVYVDEVPATCTVDGVEEHYACGNCDLLFDMNKKEVTLDDLVIKAHHTLVTVDSRQETCTEDGYYTYYHCQVCEKNFADEEGQSEIDLADITIPKKGHNIYFHEAVAATCTEDGNIAYYQCDNCHKYYSDEQGENELTINDIRVLALGHNLLHHEAVEATCTTDGNKEYYECQRCHNFYSDAEGKKQIEQNSWIIEGHHEMEHVDAVEPTFEKEGNVEHYHCDKCDKNFSDEVGENEITTPVILPALPKHLDFENDSSLSMIVNGQNTTSVISDEQHNTGNKSLKVTLGVSYATALIISDEYYDMLPEEGIIFTMYSADIFNGGISSGNPIYNAGHALDGGINYWEDDQNIWREYQVAKSSINPEQGNHWVFTVGKVTDVYLDDIRPFTKSFSFENGFDRLSIVDDDRNNVSLSNERAVSGKTSLKIEITEAHQKLFLLSDLLYNSLPEKGITFSIFCDEAFNAGVYDPNSTSSYKIDDTFHYHAPVGVWKQYTIAKNNIKSDRGDHWICLPRKAITAYIDDIFFADIADEAIGTGFEESYSLLIAKSDERNNAEISQDFAYEGHNSLKVVNTAAYNKGLIISDTFYDKLPEEGITFYIYANEKIFNCYANPVSDATLIPYYAPIGEWKKVTVKKANIKPDSGDHWVFLIGDTTTVYIDDIRIATAA